MGESPRERGGELEYGPNDMTTETALPGAPHYWALISSFVFIDTRLAEVYSVFWVIFGGAVEMAFICAVLAIDVELCEY